MRIGIGIGEPHDNAPSREIPVRIRVAEEFIGFAQEEVMARNGLVTGMDVQDGIETIFASIPEVELEALRESVMSATSGRGNVERG